MLRLLSPFSRSVRPETARRFLATDAVRQKLKEMNLRPSEEETHSSPSETLTDTSPPPAPLSWPRKPMTEKETVSTPVTPVLTDTHGRGHSYLRISLTEKCNLRCQYCMPEEGVELSPPGSMLTADEVVKIAELFVSQGVDKIRFTGGEPLVRKDAMEIFERVGKLPLKTMAITTNGITLPRKLPQLKAAGVNLLNISLDTLDPNLFTLITRRLGFERVLQGIDDALALGYTPVKVNCVMMRGMNEGELLEFVRFTKEREVDVRFIEYMPFDGNKWKDTKLVPYAEMVANIKEEFPDFRRLQDGPNDTSKAWQVPGHKGTVSFITSMTEHFCASCNRLRITADGNLKVCLFGSAEVNLKDAIRSGASDEELLTIVQAAVGKKKKAHAGMYNIANMKNRPMILIGG